jgi:predicted nucleic acid-binding protein
MTAVYDAGALIRADASDRRVWAEHKARLQAGIEPLSTAPVVAQVSRSPRQAQLRRFLRGCRVLALDEQDAHRIGALLGAAGTSDVVDGQIALLASDTRATIVTSDPDDLMRLAAHTEHPRPIRRV